VDLNVTYGRRGLAGTVRSGDNPFTAQNQLLQTRVNDLSVLAGLLPLPPPDPGQLPAFLSGGYGQSLSNIFDKDFHSVQVGLIFQLPLRNRAAEGDLAASRADTRRLDALHSRLEQFIEADVRNALQAVETARQRAEAARAARIASKEKLDSETRLFATGETTNFLVLTRQNEYTAARAAEVAPFPISIKPSPTITEHSVPRFKFRACESKGPVKLDTKGRSCAQLSRLAGMQACRQARRRNR
jgi:Outer membrane protein